MNLTELKAAGGLVGGAMVKKAVVWKHEDAKGKAVTDKFSIFVMPQSFGMIEKLFSASDSEQSRNAKYISTCVTLGENGEEAISYEDAYRLNPGLGWAILAAVHEVNNTGADRTKN
ncbi:phage tail assembly chaperone family protein, TAC [Pseudomonas paracarnis]|uniref:phage tail assembly chaperone family protein, TAC n=1 Tax=Pseudomonas paracarnis TaxID=2750625 RepID=UPI001C6F96BF|nr:phage tail assembly chaperone family protein, TAC [Pseudomonas paracarnis]MBW9244199.1 phage tail assembly chaperone family protein, TAC [Pseudomonas paracarnis]